MLTTNQTYDSSKVKSLSVGKNLDSSSGGTWSLPRFRKYLRMIKKFDTVECLRCGRMVASAKSCFVFLLCCNCQKMFPSLFAKTWKRILHGINFSTRVPHLVCRLSAQLAVSTRRFSRIYKCWRSEFGKSFSVRHAVVVFESQLCACIWGGVKTRCVF